MGCVYVSRNLQCSPRRTQATFLSSSCSLAGLFLHVQPHFHAGMLQGWRGGVGGTCCTGLGLAPGASRRFRILWLTHSFSLLTLRAYFHHTGAIIFLFLLLDGFLLVLEVITSEQRRLYPTWSPAALSWGREVQAFPHPQHSPPKVLLPYGKVEEPPETACRTCEALSACTTLRGAQATENLVGRGVARALRALSVPSSPWEL